MSSSVLASLSASRDRWAERLVAMALVALSLELLAGSGYHPAGLWVQQVVLWPTLLVLVAALAWRDRGALWVRLRGAPLLVALVGWSVVSVAWSIDPPTSAVQAVGLIGTVLGGVWMVARFERVEVACIVAVPLALAALASVTAIIIAPDHTVLPSLNPHDPAPRGLFSHRNRLGGTMALGAPLMAGLAWHRARTAHGPHAWSRDPGWWIAVAGAVLCATLTIVSSSATAEIALLTALVAVGIVNGLTRLARRARGWLLAAGVGLAVGTAALLATGPTLLQTVFDRQANLTGRLPLWEMLLSEHVAERPWLGHGLMAFWPNHEMVLPWDPPHGHNSFVDIALDLGVVASIVLATVFAWELLRAVRHQWQRATADSPPRPQPLTGTWATVLLVLGLAAFTRDPLWRAQQLQLLLLVVSVAAIEPDPEPTLRD